jgi:hypothetical protein
MRANEWPDLAGAASKPTELEEAVVFVSEGARLKV